MADGIAVSDSLVVVWTSGDREVARKMVFMYTKNARLRDWWGRVRLVVWGPSAQLLSVDLGTPGGVGGPQGRRGGTRGLQGLRRSLRGDGRAPGPGDRGHFHGPALDRDVEIGLDLPDGLTALRVPPAGLS